MRLNLQVKYSAEGYPWLCFRHAVQLAFMTSKDITVEVDDFSSENYMGPTTCQLCQEEHAEIIEHARTKLDQNRKAENGDLVCPNPFCKWPGCQHHDPHKEIWVHQVSFCATPNHRPNPNCPLCEPMKVKQEVKSG